MIHNSEVSGCSIAWPWAGVCLSSRFLCGFHQVLIGGSEGLSWPSALVCSLSGILCSRFFPPPPTYVLFISSVYSCYSSSSHFPHPRVRAQVHLGHYSPVETYSPPVRPHLSLSFVQSDFSLIIISPGRQIIANRTLSLVISLFFFCLFFPLVGSHYFHLTPLFLRHPCNNLDYFFVFPHFLHGHIMLFLLLLISSSA